MNLLIPYLFNFIVSALLIFFVFFLLIEGIILLFRIRCYRLIYWLRLLPFFKLLFSFFDYSGNRWLYAFGQRIPDFPPGTRTLTLSLGYNCSPFLEITTTTDNNLYFGLGDALRELLPPQFPLYFLVALATIAFLLFVYHCGRSLSGHLMVKMLLKKATPLQSGPLPIYESRSPSHSPLLVGIRRPLILLPYGLKDKLTQEELSAIIHHEKAHLLWKDHLVASFIHIICLIFWFIPFLKMVYKRIELARELACDQAANQTPIALASALCKSTRHFKENYLLTAIPFAPHKNRLNQRVQQALNPQHPLTKWKKIALFFSFGSLAAFILESSIFPF